MSSSLLIAGFDVLLPGSPVQLLSGWDRGAPAPSVAEIQSTVLDGAVVSGLASANRQPSFTLLVAAASRTALAAITNQILMYVDQQSWTMTFTPAGGLPVVFDCFRATASISSTLLEDAGLKQEVSIKCEALPYGRSPASQSFTLQAAAVAVIDNFTTLPTITPTTPNNWSTASSISSALSYNGSSSLLIDPSVISQTSAPAITFAKTGLSISAASGISTITVAFYSTNTLAHVSAWSLSVTVSGTTYTSTGNGLIVGGVWQQVTFTFPTAIPTGTITAYSVTTPGWSTSAQVYIDYLVAYPASGVRGSSSFGDEYLLPAVVGSARTPVNLQLTPATGTFGQFCVHAPPVDTPDSQSLVTLNSTPGTSSANFQARYNGTYSLWVSIKPNVSLTTGNTITLSIAQSGGFGLNATHVVSADEHSQGTAHMLLYFGEVLLPLVGVPSVGLPTFNLTVLLAGLTSSDHIGDVLVLDTRGQTIITDIHTPAADVVFVDEPLPGAAFGPIYTNSTGTTLVNAVSLTGNLLTGSPVWLYPPGNSRLLIWNNTAATTNMLTYFPRWLQEATA